MTSTATEYVTGHVTPWEEQRDSDNRHRWEEYYRLWRGMWGPDDRTRESERSRAIMPALQQAIESAQAELVEATFGRERWFDAIDADDPLQGEIADRLLFDLWEFKGPIAEIYILGALYGTGIGKIVPQMGSPFSLKLIAIDPREFVIDPAAWDIDSALGCAHVMYVPKWIVEQRQSQGIYNQIDVGSVDASRMPRHQGESQPRQSEMVRLVEWHGLAPRDMLDDPDEEGFGDDNLVESIITVANDSVELRAVANPVPERAFVSYQHDSVPRRFWGRGISEKGYWPQKVLDSEIRARIDALAFSVHPMMAVNATMMPARGERFSVRPGRNIPVNGNPNEALMPVNFPPPDSGTYVQSQEMAKFVELGTGQLQATTPLGLDTRNAPASGISMIMGASIRRTRRTLSNIERDFLSPLIRKSYQMMRELGDAWPDVPDFRVKFHGTLGMMAREFEITQLSQLLNSMPPGPTQLGLLKLIIQNSSLTDKSQVEALIDQQVAISLESQSQGEQDLSGQARMLSAISRAQEGQQQMQLKMLQLEEKAADSERRLQAQLARMAIDAAEKEARIANLQADSIKKIADAEAAEAGTQINTYRAILDTVTKANGSGGQ